MHIGINLLYLLPGIVGGTQTYAEELLFALSTLDGENCYTLFVNEECRDLPLPDNDNFKRLVCPVRASSRAARYRYEQMVLPRLVKREGCDILHSLGYVGPLHLSAPCRHLVTIHDLNYLAFQQAMSLQKRLLLGFFVRQTANRAHHIIAVSHFSKDQIVQHLDIPPNKITVIHEAHKRRTASQEDTDTIIARYGIRTPYIIAFSSLSLNKNIPRLIEAFKLLSATHPHQLVLLGHIPPSTDLRQQVAGMGLNERVVFTGYAPDSHVHQLLGNADLFAFPSWYEGFGLPILEAQRLGVVVASSKAASLPEVAGNGAFFFDPYSVQEMVMAISRCLTDTRLRAALKERGRLNAGRFSWQRAAEETFKVYENIYATKGHPACP